jgi:hypothetical protein
MNMKIEFPVGAITSIILFIATIYFDIWSKIPEIGDVLLAIALIILFCSSFTYEKIFCSSFTYEKKEKTK